MCTAIFDCKVRPLYGRTLDFERGFGEEAVIVPRGFKQGYRYLDEPSNSLAMIGIGAVREGRPLYYDAMNEAGVWMAGLNFPLSAKYNKPTAGKSNIASFELIPYLLGSFESLREARRFLENANITDDAVSEELPPAGLHWMAGDESGCIAAEQTEYGLKIYDNPFEALTNEPPFDYQMKRIQDFSGLDNSRLKNKMLKGLDLEFYSRGMGAFGLPGDFSSSSRFARAVYLKNYTEASECDAIRRFFHILNGVSVPAGCVMTDEGMPVRTIYSCCADIEEKTYYCLDYASFLPKAFVLGDFTLKKELVRLQIYAENKNRCR